jgi:dipeptidyl aminopeptidase/acylaminoacyl peptidase
LEKLRLDDFTKYKFLSGIEHNPSGTHACFVTHEANMDENGYASNLWVYDVAKESSFQLTALGKERSFTWLSDDELLFAATRNSKDQERQKKGEDFTVFYKINIHGGEALEAFRVSMRVQNLEPLRDDCFLLTCTYNPKRQDLSSLSEEEKATELKRREEEKDYEVLEEIPYWSNGQGFISGNRSRLYLFDGNSNSFEALTEDTLQVSDLQLNEDKTKAVFIGSDYTGMMPLSNALYLIDLQTKQIRKITPDEEFAYSSAYFLSDQELLCRGNAGEHFGLNENARFYLVDLKDGSKKLLTPDFDRSAYSSVGSDCRYGGGRGMVLDAGFLYFTTTEGESSYLHRIDKTGSIERISTATGSVDSFSVKDGEILLIALRDLKLQELYELKDGQETQLTAFNDWVNEERKLSQPEALSFVTAPGVTCEGWVLKPVDFVEGQKYPAILNIHGGPKTVYGTVFFHEMQYWANQGYFVFFCNPRGSDGKGNEFADIRGQYGTIDYDDLMRFTDLVLETYPEIDAERVGVTGGSYGGFMTNWIIGHTNRFKAAASQRSISNWISMGYTTDIGYYFAPDQVAATPWTDHEKLWNHSPLKYADRVKTPTLFIHSEEDYRCWLPEGLQMFTALKYHGVESRLCMFRGENHELSRGGKPKHRIRRLKEITTWFDRFLRGQ